ncbi:MAG: DUF1841 family protein [Gammaproteobacteria bacterium]
MRVQEGLPGGGSSASAGRNTVRAQIHLFCLAETLWRAERDRRLPDEEAYLDCLGRIASSSS